MRKNTFQKLTATALLAIAGMFGSSAFGQTYVSNASDLDSALANGNESSIVIENDFSVWGPTVVSDTEQNLRSLAIDGNGSTLDAMGAAATWIFTVENPSSSPTTLAINDLTLQNADVRSVDIYARPDDGAALYAQNSNVVLTNVIFNQNNAGNGGAVYASGSSVSLSGANRFERNTANANGGAIALVDTNLSDTGSTVYENNSSTGEFGGAIYAIGYNDASPVSLNFAPTDQNVIRFSGNSDSSGTNALHMAGNVTLNLNPDAVSTVLFDDPISDSDSNNTVNMTGAGLVAFSGDSNFSGTTNVFRGTFHINAGATYGTSLAYFSATGGKVVMSNNATLGGYTYFDSAAAKLRFEGAEAGMRTTFTDDVNIIDADSVYYEGISKDGASATIMLLGNVYTNESDGNPFSNKELLRVVRSGNSYVVTPKSLYEFGIEKGLSQNTLGFLSVLDDARNAATGNERIASDDYYNQRRHNWEGIDPLPVDVANALMASKNIGQIVLWRQADTSRRTGTGNRTEDDRQTEENDRNRSLVPSALVRGQRNGHGTKKCRKEYDLWFQAFNSNMNVWSRSIGREGYDVARTGGVFGVNTALGQKSAGGIVFGYSNPFYYNGMEKVDLNDFQVGTHAAAQLDDDWEAAFYIGFGDQNGNTYRKFYDGDKWFRFTGDYKGNTLSSTVILSKVIRVGKRSVLRPTLGIDTEHTWFFNFTESADQPLVERQGFGLGYARRQFHRTYHDRTMARIGLMGQTGGDRWGLNGRVFYSPTIGGDDVSKSRLTLLDGWLSGATQTVRSLPIGREFVNVAMGGHLILNKKTTTVLFADYSATLYQRATTQVVSLGAQRTY